MATNPEADVDPPAPPNGGRRSWRHEIGLGASIASSSTQIVLLLHDETQPAPIRWIRAACICWTLISLLPRRK